MTIENFKLNTCPNCGFRHDPNFPECPKCFTRNSNPNIKKAVNELVFIDLPRLLGIIIAYLGTFYLLPVLINLITSLICGGLGMSEIEITSLYSNANYVLGVQLSCYIVGIIIMGFILRPYLKYFIKEFETTRFLMVTMLFSVILIVTSFIYSNFLASMNIGENINQTNLENIILNSPALAFFVVVIFGPIYEELVFRVAIYGIGNKINKFFGYLFSIVIFSLVHMNLIGEGINYVVEFANLPIYLFDAWLLVFAYEDFDSKASIVPHMLNNLVSFVIIFL